MSEPKTDTADIQGDLAFVKALVSEGGRAQASAGAAFLTGGLCYGIQCLGQFAEVIGWLPWGLPGLVLSVLPTVVFLAVLGVILWRARRDRQHGVATRALNAAFSSAGLANLFMVAVFGYNAAVEKSLTIWLFYPAVICAFQGAVWSIAFAIRRKAWLALVSAGWFVVTVALGLTIHAPAYYLLVLAAALLVLMAGSGYAMMREAGK